jgi:hypothetical protein
VVLQAEQVAIGRGHVGADQDRLSALEKLVMGAEADAGQIFLVVEATGAGHGLSDDVVDAAQGQGIVEEVGEQFRYPAG